MKYWSDLNKGLNRLANKHAGVVYDNEIERSWDWGQALCRGLYGVDWMNHPSFIEADDAHYPPVEAFEILKGWESGQFPEWLEIPPPRTGWISRV